MKYLSLAIFALVGVMLVSAQNTTTAVPTTAPATNATTASTNATTATTNATTATTKPTTATTIPPTTKPVPTPWNVTDKSGKVCILARMDAEITVSYAMTNNTMNTVTLLLPENADVNSDKSSCGNDTTPAVLVVGWDTSNTLRQEFTLNVTSKTYALSMVQIELLHDESHFPSSNDTGKIVTYKGTPAAAFFQSMQDKSYKCNSMANLALDNNANITYSNVKVQPFGVANDSFSDEYECAADKTTTPMPTTSTPKPTSSPPAGNWTVQDGNGTTCMNMTFKAKFTIKYWTTDNKQASVDVNLPDAASADDSTCNDTDASFVLSFFEGWQTVLTFHNDDDEYKVTMYNFTYVYDGNLPNNIKQGQTEKVYNDKLGIEANVNKYYKCDSTAKYSAGNTTTIFSDMKIQPFAKGTNGTKGEDYNECLADSAISNIVPIAVGCALAGLVIIVLIAYLIGRSRSGRSGYESV